MPSGINSTSALRWTTIAVYVCWPLWPALVLASWTARLVHPLFERMQRAFRGRRRATAVLVFLLFLLVVSPLVLMRVGVRDLLASLSDKASAEGVLEQIAAGGGSSGLALPRTLEEGMDLVRRYGSQGFDLLSNIAVRRPRGCS